MIRSGVPGGTPLLRFRCNNCSYGASCRIAPERCPMCGGTVWEFEAWRPFSSFRADLEGRLTREGR